MKTVKRCVCVLLALMTALTLTACGSPARSKSLYDHGLELITLMEEMAGHQEVKVITAYSSTPEVDELLATLTGHDRPKEVYKITASEEALLNLAGIESASGMSEELRRFILSRSRTAFASQINATSGAYALAAASMCTASRIFVSDELTEDVIYLYVYENAAPAMVTFVVGEDNAVCATAVFILNDGLYTGTQEDIARFFAEYQAQVERIEG